jgi:hypothetical protein
VGCRSPDNRDEQAGEPHAGSGCLRAVRIGTGLLLWTLSETRATARRELRAYVSVIPHSIELKATNIFEVHLKLHNGGSTPAHEVIHYGHVQVLDIPLRSDPSHQYGGTTGIDTPHAIFAAEAGTER